MRYFILSQDDRIPDVVEPMNVSHTITREMWSKGKSTAFAKLNLQFPIKEKAKNRYIDFIQKPIPLFSNQLKQIIETYIPNLDCQLVVLVDLKKMRQEVYWLIFPPSIACLSDKSEFYPNGMLKRLVIDEQKVPPYPLFKIQNLKEDYIMINLALAESILRRDVTGIRLTRAEMES